MLMLFNYEQLDLATVILFCTTFFLSGLVGLVFLSLSVNNLKRKRSEFLKEFQCFRPVDSDNGLGKISDPDDKILPMLQADITARPCYTPSQVTLSVVVPAYNEEKRIRKMLDDCIHYLEGRENESDDNSFTYEIIVVDDGSSDRTSEVANAMRIFPHLQLKVIRLEQNLGKGAAVRTGVLHARGKIILFADADGATLFEDFARLEQELISRCGGSLDESFPAVVVGSRKHLEDSSTVERSFLRTILMHCFHAIVYILAVRTVRDTQCGFKLFTRAAAAKLFPAVHIERWAFDVELLFLAEKWNLTISEVCVAWKEVDGSKIVPVFSWLQMGRDIFLLWIRYKFNIWTENDYLL